MRGPKPRPTRLREQQAATNHKRRNRSEPEFEPAAAADCPAWLDEKGRIEWNRLAPDLIAQGLLTKADVAAFALYCYSYSQLQHAAEAINEHGQTAELRTDKGDVRASIPIPDVGIYVKMADKVRQIAAEFGLTPSARGRIELDSLPVAPTGDDLSGMTPEEIDAEIERLRSEIGTTGAARKSSIIQ